MYGYEKQKAETLGNNIKVTLNANYTTTGRKYFWWETVWLDEINNVKFNDVELHVLFTKNTRNPTLAVAGPNSSVFETARQIKYF